MRQEPAVARFAEELRTLRAEAGNPPLAEIARLSGHRIAKATIHDQLSGRRKRLPDASFVTAFYEACLAFAQTIGRGAERLGTLDQWIDMLAAADRGADELVSPPYGAHSTVHVAARAADPAPTEPAKPAMAGAPAAAGGPGHDRHRDLRQAAVVVSVLVIAAAAVAGLLVFWLGRQPAAAPPAAKPPSGSPRAKSPATPAARPALASS
jgi:hypothetical protein